MKCIMTTGQERQRLSLWKHRLVIAAVAFGVTACGGDTASPIDEQYNLLRVVVSDRAVTLSTVAPHNTIQLSAIGYDGTGQIIDDAQPVFVSSDDNISVSPDGLVTAVRSGSIPSLVIARIQHNGVTRADSTYVLVTDAVNPPPLQQLSITLDRIVIGEGVKVNTIIRDSAGNILQVPIDYRSSDPSVATVDSAGNVLGITPEAPVTISATATVYGITLRDTIHLNVGYPTMISIWLMPTTSSTGETIYEFYPSNVYIAEGGMLLFLNLIAGDLGGARPNYDFKIDVSFDTPSAAVAAGPPFPTGDGNIPLFGASGPEDGFAYMQARVFPQQGTYKFSSETIKSSGTIHVR
jgi:hypothetical protein